MRLSVTYFQHKCVFGEPIFVLLLWLDDLLASRQRCLLRCCIKNIFRNHSDVLIVVGGHTFNLNNDINNCTL